MIQVVHICDRCADMSIEKVPASGNRHISAAPRGWQSWHHEVSPTVRVGRFLLCGRCITSLDSFINDVASRPVPTSAGDRADRATSPEVADV